MQNGSYSFIRCSHLCGYCGGGEGSPSALFIRSQAILTRLHPSSGGGALTFDSSIPRPNKKATPKRCHFSYFGGGEGSRTPVRKFQNQTFSGCSSGFKISRTRKSPCAGQARGSFIILSQAQSFARAVPLVNDTLAPAIRVPPAGHYTALGSVS